MSDLITTRYRHTVTQGNPGYTGIATNSVIVYSASRKLPPHHSTLATYKTLVLHKESFFCVSIMWISSEYIVIVGYCILLVLSTQFTPVSAGCAITPDA